jgi:tetratricopeptide (TPR) repeat protein
MISTLFTALRRRLFEGLHSMEFFVFFDGAELRGIQFCIGPSAFTTTLQEIQDRFLDAIRGALPEHFELSAHRLYLDDHTDPLLSQPLQPIDDLSLPVASLPSRHFDLLLTANPPLATHMAPTAADIRTAQSACDDLLAKFANEIKNRDFQTAATLLADADQKNPGKFVQKFRSAKVLLGLKTRRYKSTRDYLVGILRAAPSDRESQLMLAHVHQKLGLHEEAIEQFKRLTLFVDADTASYDAMKLGIAKSLLAMDQPDKALTLIEPILTENESNLQARLLAARIYARQGRLVEAFRLVVHNFSIEPDNKASRKFIGHHTVNAHQVELLKGELGDGIRSANVMFYVGHILNEFGSCQAADSFMRDARRLAPADPTIFVGALLNFFALSPTIEEFSEFFGPFLEVVTEMEEFSQFGVNFQRLVSDFDRKDVRQAIATEITVPSRNEPCTFEIVIFDRIWAVALAQLYLFTHGYITDAELIGTGLRRLTERYDFSTTILSKQIEMQQYISLLLPTIPRPLVRARPVFTIGDDAAFPLAWRTLRIQNEPCQFVPIYIPDIRPMALVSKCHNAIQFAYRREFEKLPASAFVVLAFGTLQGHDDLMRTHPSEDACSLLGALELQFRAILQIAKHLWRTKQCRVWVHPVVVVHIELKEYFRLLMQINEQLALRLRNLNREIPAIAPIDVVPEMVDEEPEPRWKPEFAADLRHLRPAYARLVERAMNAAPPPG